MKIKNPVIWADVPDNDVIRVGQAFYMVSTSMHSMPGCPIMKSTDLQNWEIVSYIFDRLEDNPGHNLEDGKGIYGQGSWAASLRYVDGTFYCLFNCNDTHHAYVFTTKDIEKSGWERHELPLYLHDPSFLIDDDGRRYIVSGNGDIRITELNSDMVTIKEGGLDRVLFRDETEGLMLRCEGGHAYKINGHYYAIYIEWPKGGIRREVCYRWDSLESLPMTFSKEGKSGPGLIERRIVLESPACGCQGGVAQGAIFDLPDGDHWAAVLFQDHGAVGRIPYVLPLSWEKGWPIPGRDGRVEEEFDLPDAWFSLEAGDACEKEPTKSGVTGYGLCISDDFDYSDKCLDLRWQWNHNPDQTLWSVSDRPGWLRLTNGHLRDRVLRARNTLTQRTYGPKCTCRTLLDATGLKAGDRAGLVAIQGQFGLIGVELDDKGELILYQACNSGQDYGEKVMESVNLADRRQVYLEIAFDFKDQVDRMIFSFSLDGKTWTPMQDSLTGVYTLDHFMGYRIGLFSYGTKNQGGYADFDYLSFTD